MSYIEKLFEIGLPTIILIVLGLLFGIVQIIKAVDSILERFGVSTRSSRRRDSQMRQITEHEQRLDNMENMLQKVLDAEVVSLGDKINRNYKRYFSLGYIPEDEYDEFIRLHDTYNGVGGNHTGDLKFNRCIEKLPIKTQNHES